MLKLETVDNHGFRPQFLIPKIQDSSQLLSFSPLIVRLYDSSSSVSSITLMACVASPHLPQPCTTIGTSDRVFLPRPSTWTFLRHRSDQVTCWWLTPRLWFLAHGAGQILQRVLKNA